MTMSCCRYPGLRKNLMMLRPSILRALGHLGRLDTYAGASGLRTASLRDVGPMRRRTNGS